jgi:hypothetical protein
MLIAQNGRMVSWKSCTRKWKRSWLTLRYYPAFAEGNLRGPLGTLVGVVGVLARFEPGTSEIQVPTITT